MSINCLSCPENVDTYDWLKQPQVIMQLAAKASPKAVLNLSSLPEVVAFVRIAELDAKFGQAVRELSITVSPSEFSEHAARATYCPTIRSVLRLTPKVTDLTLLLPKSTPPDVFFLVRFRDLVFFKTNLPHHKVKPFVVMHDRTLAVLVLDHCGADVQCPLASDVDLGSLSELECDASCVRALASSNLAHLRVKNDSTARCLPVIFRQLPTSLPELYSLTVDFYPADVDILRSIILVAPRVTKLKLLEKFVHTGRRVSNRRPFNDHITWHHDLRRLPMLEELALRTSTPLVRQLGHLEEERRLIHGWTRGVRRSTTRTAAKAHPALYHVRIWYGQTTQTRTLSKWFRDSEEWFRLGDPVTGASLDCIDF